MDTSRTQQDGLWASLLDYTSGGLGLSPDCVLFFGATFYSHIASFYPGGGGGGLGG